MNKPRTSPEIIDVGTGDGQRCELLDVFIDHDLVLTLVGDDCIVRAKLRPSVAALLVSRIGFELASRIVEAEHLHDGTEFTDADPAN